MLDLILFVLGVTLSGGGADTGVMSADSSTAMIAEITEPAPETAEENTDVFSGGTWNTTGSSEGSWISNRSSDSSDATGGEGSGNSLLAGVVEAEPAPSLGSEETFVAEPQIPTGKFTTATEVKPILAATRGGWVAVREYDGQDLLYVTPLWAWRCGLLQMRYSINGGPMQVWPLPPCHENTNAPNAITDTDGLPYAAFPQGSIQSIQVELLLDDLSEDSSAYVRTDVLMP